MVVLKAGDYVVVEGKLGRIALPDFHPHFHLVYLLDNSMPMAVLKKDKTMKKVDPAIYPILSDSISNKEEL